MAPVLNQTENNISPGFRSLNSASDHLALSVVNIAASDIMATKVGEIKQACNYVGRADYARPLENKVYKQDGINGGRVRA